VHDGRNITRRQTGRHEHPGHMLNERRLQQSIVRLLERTARAHRQIESQDRLQEAGAVLGTSARCAIEAPVERREARAVVRVERTVHAGATSGSTVDSPRAARAA